MKKTCFIFILLFFIFISSTVQSQSLINILLCNYITKVINDENKCQTQYSRQECRLKTEKESVNFKLCNYYYTASSKLKKIKTTQYGTTIKVYEYKSSDFPSGLVFIDKLGYAKEVGITRSIPAAVFADFYLFNKAINDPWEVRSPKLRKAPGTRTTEFSTVVYDTDSLNDIRIKPPEISSYSLDRIMVTPAIVASGKVFFARTQDQNYVRVLIKKGNNGTLFQGEYPDRYIEVEFSYQFSPNIPYAQLFSNDGDQK